jgi:16S rRNA (guanine966-N2)-methyltransferase
MSIRITAGQKRGMKIEVPHELDEILRPTKDRVREAMFSAVISRMDLEGIRVLDLFSGTGMLAFEALSRGASHATIVDSSDKVLRYSLEVASKLGLRDKITAIKADVLKYIDSENDQYDLIFLDPPYSKHDFLHILELLISNSRLAPKGLIVYEEDSKFFGSQFELSKDSIEKYFSSITVKTYGKTSVAFLKS